MFIISFIQYITIICSIFLKNGSCHITCCTLQKIKWVATKKCEMCSKPGHCNVHFETKCPIDDCINKNWRN